jgi:two-component system, OmpR family, sensor kinase
VRRLLPASLTGRLLVTSVALVAFVSLLIAVATTVAIRSYLIGRLDVEVRESAFRAVGALSGGPSFAPEGDGPGPEGFDPAFGQGSGTVTAYVTDAGRYGEVITSHGELLPLAGRGLDVLADVPVDGEPHTVGLPGMEDYRVVATDVGDTTVVSGLPTEEVEQTVGSLVGWEALFLLLGVLAAGGGALVLVGRQLRPLREVAGTAHEVAGLPLSTGEVGMTARVPDRLTDERTEVGQMGAALNTLLGRIESALDARHRSEQQVRQFVADASHELRTPLAAIHGYAELSRRTTADPAGLTHAMGKVETEASRMSSLVEDLLLLARLDAGRPLERNEVDLTKMVLESVADARVMAPEHRWALDLADEPVTLTGDELRLHQVLTNLLSNARRHTPAGTTVTVGTHLSEESSSAVLTVHDDGPGIAADAQESVFERFTRGDSARTRASGGVGLGLSLARAITEAHGGRIGVRSRPGSTCFTVTLPR